MFCKIFGHKFDLDHYGRVSTAFRVTDGIGRVHVRIVRNCQRCDEWVQCCMLHLPKEGE